MFDLLGLRIVEADNVRFAVAVAVFHDHDVANDRLAMLVCAVEVRADMIQRKIQQPPFFVDDHAKRPWKTHRVNVFDVAANGSANGFVERIVEILNANLIVRCHNNAFHSDSPFLM